MPKFVLDTDHITIIQLRSEPGFSRFLAHAAQCVAADLAYSIASFHEQVVGAHAYVNAARRPADVVRGYAMLNQVLRDFSAVEVLSFDSTAAASFDLLRSQRVRIATMDLRIASIALSRGLVLLTRNRADFGRVPGLATQDWTV